MGKLKAVRIIERAQMGMPSSYLNTAKVFHICRGRCGMLTASLVCRAHARDAFIATPIDWEGVLKTFFRNIALWMALRACKSRPMKFFGGRIVVKEAEAAH